jgi:hypothetical protein
MCPNHPPNEKPQYPIPAYVNAEIQDQLRLSMSRAGVCCVLKSRAWGIASSNQKVP